MIAPADADVLRLPRGVRLKRCEVRDRWFLLAPERALALDPVAVAVLGALDGRRDFAAVTAKLAAEFSAPPERVAADARGFLARLMEGRMVETT